MFKLGAKSLQRLNGVHPDLVSVVKRAIQLTTVDFSVNEGLRSLEKQKELFASGASKTMNSRHLTGHAVDLVPYVGGVLIWEWSLIFSIAVAVDASAAELGVEIRWGGVWDKLMSEYGGSDESMKKEVDLYCKRHPGIDFIDGPHFELSWDKYK